MSNNLFTTKTIVKSEYTYMPVEDFKAFLEVISPIKYSRFCDYNSSKVQAYVVLPNKVKVEFDVTGMEIKPNGSIFYARRNTITHVRIHHWMWNNIHCSGKGSRSLETWGILCDHFSLIPGMTN